MDKEKTKDLIKILKAFLEGETIEQRSRSQENPQPQWLTHYGDCWDLMKYEYRIKPKPQYRPFKDIDECWAEMKNHQPFGWIKINGNYTNIVDFDTTGAFFRAKQKWWATNRDDMSENIITFADGTPFGMKVTDNCPMLRKAPK